jgi:hypothetical protein
VGSKKVALRLWFVKSTVIPVAKTGNDRSKSVVIRTDQIEVFGIGI